MYSQATNSLILKNLYKSQAKKIYEQEEVEY
jgi:hypothetical protein